MFRPRWWLFWFGLTLIGIALWLTLTPTLWVWEGRPDESYPELGMLLIGLPLALIVTLAGFGVGRRWGRKRSNRNEDGIHG